jgi:serine/threonine protein kinase
MAEENVLDVVLTLTVLRGPEAGVVYRFEGPSRLIVGRAADADLRLADPYIGRRHIVLEMSPPFCRLLDIGNGSTNIPHVNGVAVQRCDLRPGDIIELGYTRIRLDVEPGFPRAVCSHCGNALDVCAPGLCPSCLHKGENRSGATPSPVVVHCSRCHCDLTRRANCDGRAADTLNFVCRNCLPDGDAFAGKRVGEYEVRKRLGEGGMGVVYLAWHESTCRLVALKQIKDITRDTLVRRFDREVRVLRRLSHPGIVRFLDTGIDQTGLPYVVSEYISGGTLEQYRRRLGVVPPVVALRIITAVLESLQYVHAWPIIHRDIKPDNILLCGETSGVLMPKLSDFGLSLFHERAGGTRITKPGSPLGTLMFIAPEQARDAARASVTSDVYSVGVTLYFLLTGCYTFNFPSPEDLQDLQGKRARFASPEAAARECRRMERLMYPYEIIQREQPVPILVRNPAVPSRVAAAVDRAVHKDPRRRFQTCEEFRRALLDAPSFPGNVGGSGADVKCP